MKNSNARRAGEIRDGRSKGWADFDLGAPKPWLMPKIEAAAYILAEVVAGRVGGVG
jgi:hypothetical protein